MRREPVPRVFWSHVLAAALLVGAGCTTTPEFCAADPADPASFATSLRVVDESGAAIAGAAAILDGISIAGAADGTIVLPALDGPVMLVVTAPGHFSEPVPVGASDDGQRLTIKLWAQGGERFVMHSAGDVMFGRRYEAPTTGDALIPVDDVVAGAEFVVDPVSAAFRVADFRTVNLETVVSERGASSGYPGKRFIVRSRPDTLAALVKLGVDVASQANNHSRDYLDVGIVDTIAALEAHHLPVVGVSSGADAPAITAITAVRGARVAVMAFTTVDGSTVNDAYPDQDEPRPSDVKPEEAWLYQDREWGFVGGVVTVPEASRRIGAAWLLFEDLEPRAGEDLGAMWGSISAVYPEMQDWVARRGHGGAALWDPVASAAEVAALKADDHLVVLQLHAGYEFQDSPSDNVRAIAREAIDAGADIVIGHHPHVLQGLEIYKGRLIAYSMGNFIFDQDFLATLASGFLRTVWDGDTLLEARLVPLEISDYRPLPVVGVAARQNLFRVWERSLLAGGASKDELGLVHTFPITLDADTVPAQLIVEHNTARLVATPPAPTTVELTVPAHSMVPLPFDGLVAARLGRAPAASDTVWVGKDLFGWGRFEDETADGLQSGATHWNLDTCRELVAHGGGATGDGFLRLMRDQTENAITRPVVRISLPRHLAWEHGPGGSLPLDPEPSYSLHAQARVSGPGEVFARVAVYYFDNKNPTEDAATVLLKEIERPIVLAHDGEWHEVELPFTTEELDSEDHEANAVMLYFLIDYPGSEDVTTLDVDDVAFIEWREAAAMPDRFGDYDWVRNDGDGVVELRAPGLGATAG